MVDTIKRPDTADRAAGIVRVALDAIKARQRSTWASGDFGIIGTTLQIVGESLCEAVDLRAGSKVLDVAAGNGNCSLAAARRWCDVTSTDYVPALLEDGRRRAEADRLSIRFQEADAEAPRFADGSFDIVLSSFGVMFAPDQYRAAHELLSVCRHEGRIGMANWTPRGFIGPLFAVVGRYAPPPPRSRPLRAGDWRNISITSSAAQRPIFARPLAISCSGIVRRSTGSRCSGRGTARCTKRSRGCLWRRSDSWRGASST